MITSKYTEFCYYLAGLWEGDGHSVGPPFPYVAITFSEKQYPLCISCQYILGGLVRHKKSEHAWVLTIKKQEDLFQFTQLIGDKLRSPKATEIWEIAQWIEIKSKNSKKPLTSSLRYSVDTTLLSQNAWLAGFIDADAGFKIRYTKKVIDLKTQKVKTKERIALSCVIEQRKIHKKSGLSYQPLMKVISTFFTVPLRFSKHNEKTYFCIEVSSFYKLSIIIDYFKKYSLLSSKYLDYQDWLDTYTLIQNKDHLTLKGKQQILYKKNGMNRQRMRYCWSHLLYFFAFVIIEKEIQIPFLNKKSPF